MQLGHNAGEAGLASSSKEQTVVMKRPFWKDWYKSHSLNGTKTGQIASDKGAAGDGKSLNSNTQGGETKVDQTKSLSKNANNGQTTLNWQFCE